MTVFLAADLEAIPGTKPSSGGSSTPTSASGEHLETWAPVPPSTGSASASVVAETGPAVTASAFTAPAFVESAPAAPAVTVSTFTAPAFAASAVTAPAFTASGPSAPAFSFGPEQVGTVALNSSASSVAAMDPQFFSFGASAFSYGGSSDVIENWGQNEVGPAVFHFVESANWSTAESDSGGSWFTDWLYDLLA
jgi:hypothetical protein